MWELSLRVAILLSFISSIIQWRSGLNIANDTFGDLCSFAASVTFAFDIYISRVYRLRAHWRTITVFCVNMFCSWVYICVAIRPLIEQCNESWYSNIVDIAGKVIESSLWLHAALSFPKLLLISSILSFILVMIFPVPSMPTLQGKKYSRIGTLNFSIPMKLSGSESQLYKGDGVHTCGGEQEGVIEEYDLTVQCWFPVIRQESSMHRCMRYLDLIPTSTMWSSGHPAHQDNEVEHLLNCVAKLGGLPSLLLSQLALSKSRAEYYDGVDRIFGIKENPRGLEKNTSAAEGVSTSTSSASSEPDNAFFTSSGHFRSMDEDTSSLNQLLQHIPLFPIAIYSHGNYGWRQIASTSCEELASQGFVVFSMDHAPSCLSARPLPVCAPEKKEANKGEHHSPSRGDARGYRDFDFALPKDITPGTVEERDFFAGGADRRVREVQRLIDHLCTPLTRQTADGYSSEDSSGYKESDYYSNNIDSVSCAASTDGDRVAQSLKTIGKTLFHADVDKICIFGHSFGAGTCIATACRDSRVRAVCALDAWMFPAKDAYSADSLYTGFYRGADGGSLDRSSNVSKDSHNAESLTPVRLRSRNSSAVTTPRKLSGEDNFEKETRKDLPDAIPIASADKSNGISAIPAKPSDAYPDSVCQLPSQEHLASPFGPKVLFLTSDKWNIAPYQAPFRQTFIKKCFRENVFNLVVLGTNHQNFCDTHLLARSFLMRGGSKLGPTVDPFVNIAVVNEVICDFFMQACDSSLHSPSPELGSHQPCPHNPHVGREPDVQRFLKYLHLGQSAKSEVADSATVMDTVAAYNASNGLVSTSGSLNHYVSKDTDCFISEHYRDEDSLPDSMNWKYYNLCLPNQLRSLLKSR
jgi:dienelactone hydrolase